MSGSPSRDTPQAIGGAEAARVPWVVSFLGIWVIAFLAALRPVHHSAATGTPLHMIQAIVLLAFAPLFVTIGAISQLAYMRHWTAAWMALLAQYLLFAFMGCESVAHWLEIIKGVSPGVAHLLSRGIVTALSFISNLYLLYVSFDLVRAVEFSNWSPARRLPAPVALLVSLSVCILTLSASFDEQSPLWRVLEAADKSASAACLTLCGIAVHQHLRKIHAQAPDLAAEGKYKSESLFVLVRLTLSPTCAMATFIAYALVQVAPFDNDYVFGAALCLKVGCALTLVVCAMTFAFVGFSRARLEAEAQRRQADSHRQAAEEQQALALQEKNAAMQQRQVAESLRQQSESDRLKAERQSVEASIVDDTETRLAKAFEESSSVQVFRDRGLEEIRAALGAEACLCFASVFTPLDGRQVLASFAGHGADALLAQVRRSGPVQVPPGRTPEEAIVRLLSEGDADASGWRVVGVRRVVFPAQHLADQIVIALRSPTHKVAEKTVVLLLQTFHQLLSHAILDQSMQLLEQARNALMIEYEVDKHEQLLLDLVKSDLGCLSATIERSAIVGSPELAVEHWTSTSTLAGAPSAIQVPFVFGEDASRLLAPLGGLGADSLGRLVLRRRQADDEVHPFFIIESPLIYVSAHLLGMAVEGQLHGSLSQAFHRVNSHEVKTQVNILRNNLRWISTRWPSQDRAEAQEILGESVAAIQMLKRLTAQLDTLFRSHSAEDVDVADLARTVFAQARPEAVKLGVDPGKIAIHLAVVGRRHTARVSREDVLQALGNLVSNAVKYCGGLELRLTGTVTERRTDIKIEIEDHGIGIEESFVVNLFRFARRGDNATRVAIGKGIGLWLSMRLLQRNKCALFLDSRSSPTRFVVTLPRLLTKGPAKNEK